MAFPELAWPSGGELYSRCFSAEEEEFKWDILDFLGDCREWRLKLGATDKKLKTVDFSFAGATWNLFFSFDQEECYCQFGINVHTHRKPNTEFDCNCDIFFGSCSEVIKKIECKFRHDGVGTSWAADDFFSYSELDKFLHNGTKIICKISKKKSSAKETTFSLKEFAFFAGESGIKAPTQTHLLKNDSVAFPDSTFPCGGELYRDHLSVWVTNVTWLIDSFLRDCLRERNVLEASNKKLKSTSFSFGDATLNFFASFDAMISRSQFGINVLTHGSSDKVVFNCCNISFHRLNLNKIMKMRCKIICKNGYSSHRAVKDFLSDSELNKFLHDGFYITCRINRAQWSMKGASSKIEVNHSNKSTFVGTHTLTWEHRFKDSCLRTESTHSSKSIAVEAYTGTQHQENEDSDDEDNYSDDEGDYSDDEGDYSDDEGDCNEEDNYSDDEGDYDEEEDNYSDDEGDYNDEEDNYNEEEDYYNYGEDDYIDEEDDYIDESEDDEDSDENEDDEDSDDDDEDILVKVCQDFKNLLLSGEGSDVTIQVQDEKFKAHRSVLIARSSVFRAMFRHNMKENATGVIDVEDCDPVSFPIMLEFIYCGTTENLSVENVFSLYMSADKYDIQDLKRKCLKFIKKNISVDTFCETLWLSLLHSETNLLQFTINFFTKNLKAIVATAKWQAFSVENPIEGNEIYSKTLASDKQA